MHHCDSALRGRRLSRIALFDVTPPSGGAEALRSARRQVARVQLLRARLHSPIHAASKAASIRYVQRILPMGTNTRSMARRVPAVPQPSARAVGTAPARDDLTDSVRDEQARDGVHQPPVLLGTEHRLEAAHAQQRPGAAEHRGHPLGVCQSDRIGQAVHGSSGDARHAGSVPPPRSNIAEDGEQRARRPGTPVGRARREPTSDREALCTLGR
jgi:hypothetical protein